MLQFRWDQWRSKTEKPERGEGCKIWIWSDDVVSLMLGREWLSNQLGGFKSRCAVSMFWNTQCHVFRRLQKWWTAFENYLKQLHVFVKNQNFSVYITITSLTSLIVALKETLYDLTNENVLVYHKNM